MNGKAKFCLLFIFSSLFTSTLYAKLKLPAIISDNMVLQRKTKVPIWGWSEPGRRIAIKTTWLGNIYYATADSNGKWNIELETTRAKGGQEITIAEENDSVKIKNILIGEVWLCSGQSNMHMPVGSSENAEREIAEANYPEIRFFTVQLKASEEPLDDVQGKWQICSSKTVPYFSAVGYFFGREIHNTLRVPVGLINSSWGGTPAEAWTKKEVFINNKNLKYYIERDKEWKANKKNYQREYDVQLKEWEQEVEKTKEEGKKLPPKPKPPVPLRLQHQCSTLYNGMLNPLIPFAIKGVIWYQGESNAGQAFLYRELFPAMIENWRTDWRSGTFLFYFVQLAPFKKHTPQNRPAKLPEKGIPAESNWAELREAQLMTLALPNTGMAVTMDIGDPYDIHPKNKQEVGRRLALWALAKDYGKDIVYSGPLYQGMEVEGNKIRIYFNHVSGGLIVRGDKLEGFAIAGEDRKFVWADAKIDGESIVVWSVAISKPIAVRYGWGDWIECNLFNKEGLPASPFRTDHWPGITQKRQIK